VVHNRARLTSTMRISLFISESLVEAQWWLACAWKWEQWVIYLDVLHRPTGAGGPPMWLHVEVISSRSINLRPFTLRMRPTVPFISMIIANTPVNDLVVHESGISWKSVANKAQLKSIDKTIAVVEVSNPLLPIIPSNFRKSMRVSVLMTSSRTSVNAETATGKNCWTCRSRSYSTNSATWSKNR